MLHVARHEARQAGRGASDKLFGNGPDGPFDLALLARRSRSVPGVAVPDPAEGLESYHYPPIVAPSRSHLGLRHARDSLDRLRNRW